MRALLTPALEPGGATRSNPRLPLGAASLTGAGRIWQSDEMRYDVVMVVGDEANAEENWRQLVTLAPRALRVSNVKSIHAAYAAAASIATTPHFFLVDGDNWVYPHFRFEMRFGLNSEEAVFWFALNPVNRLTYTNGGIKLMPTAYMRQALSYDSIDVVMNLIKKENRRLLPRIASEHRFNTAPFATWRTAFREAAKLWRRLGNDSQLTLYTWCHEGADAAFGEWCVLGAREGRAFSEKYHDDPEMISRINDYEWMARVFEGRHGSRAHLQPSGGS
jgi:hypothetical protein